MHFHWNSPVEIPNREEIQQSLQFRGGSVIEFRRVTSVLVFTQINPHFEWLESGGSRFGAGLPHAGYCLLLGWWSPGGLLANLGVALNNLCGGVDVTPLFREESDAEAHEAAIRRMERERKREVYVRNSALALCLLGCLALAIYLD